MGKVFGQKSNEPQTFYKTPLNISVFRRSFVLCVRKNNKFKEKSGFCAKKNDRK